MKLNEYEKKLVEHAKKRVLQLLKMRRRKGLYDSLYAFVMSDSGKVYEGTFIDTKINGAGTCAERVAIANMLLNETELAKVKHVVVIAPVGKGGNLTPCAACRGVIDEYSDGKATVICLGAHILSTEPDISKLFKNIRKFTIRELYPEPWIEGTWD